jgi:hypothetical protein
MCWVEIVSKHRGESTNCGAKAENKKTKKIAEQPPPIALC